MSKIALYTKYRSSTFEEVVGQEHVVRSIRNAVRENKVSHAYLFCGPRGTGKTTMARLLAKAVNCRNPENAPCEKCEDCIAANNGTHPDIVEINAANETSVDNIRELIDRTTLAPMQGKYKIYIIDEVHQLSSAASSALLKTLEEPPEHVIFVLATTDPQKLLPTIISRCQRYDFTKVRSDQIADHLLDIAEKENIRMERDAAEMIAALADGGMRDALSIMDQCASYTNDNITLDEIDRIYGLATTQEKLDLLKDILSCSLPEMLERIRTYEQKGIDLQRFTDGLVDILKDAVIYSHTLSGSLLKVINTEQASELIQIASEKVCMHAAETFIAAKDRYRTATSAVSAFEVVCLGIATRTEEPVQTEIRSERTVKKAPEKEPARMVEPEPEKPVQKPEKPAETKEIPQVEEKAEEAVIRTEEPVPSDRETLLKLLVQCNKACKSEDEAKYAKLRSMNDMDAMKYVTLLRDTVIAASGEDCILLMGRNRTIVNRINDRKMNEELYRFFRESLGIDKMVFGAMKDELNAAASEFRVLMNDNRLPEAMKVERYHEEIHREPTPEEKVKDLFGAENVDVIEGE